jgi:hypothetical protein
MLITTSRPRGPISSSRGKISVVIPAAAAPPFGRGSIADHQSLLRLRSNCLEGKAEDLCRATRRHRPPSDADIERGLRERAVSDPRAAEILLRWLQRPRVEERVGGVDLDSMSERELERLHAGLVKLASMPDEELQALVEHLLADELCPELISPRA